MLFIERGYPSPLSYLLSNTLTGVATPEYKALYWESFALVNTLSLNRLTLLTLCGKWVIPANDSHLIRDLLRT